MDGLTPKQIAFLLIGVTSIGCAGIVATAMLQPPFASLESGTKPVTSGQVLDRHFIPSHIETVYQLVNGKTKPFPMSIGANWQLTLRSPQGHENVWNVTEQEYNDSRLGENFTIKNPDLKPTQLGIAVD